MNSQNSSEKPVEQPPLVRRLQAAVAHMDPHHKKRENGKLIIDALEEITRLRASIAAIYAHAVAETTGILPAIIAETYHCIPELMQPPAP